ncbi:hypothetical protein PR202_gb00515 [Eleusine coracana subsp. coracana]|uniref:Uncharacterized protein n=1 Tax=Eleusine coracana subsp. coracana TaxID=191504 RepID=A0AAV5DTJ6_ELECO|nr:hypothetical protein PR202_gb00515 [Eleusine coracana subsp. coracana]
MQLDSPPSRLVHAPPLALRLSLPDTELHASAPRRRIPPPDVGALPHPHSFELPSGSAGAPPRPSFSCGRRCGLELSGELGRDQRCSIPSSAALPPTELPSDRAPLAVLQAPALARRIYLALVVRRPHQHLPLPTSYLEDGILRREPNTSRLRVMILWRAGSPEI